MKGQYNRNLSSHFILITCFLILAYAQHWFNDQTQKPKITISKQDEALNFSENFLRLLSFGQERLFSSLLWVHTLMESDIEHYKKKDLNSWMYLRFKTISVLDPYFYENYHYGGKYLSIVKDDLLGARDIYERGIKYYPNDFHLRFNNGFNYYFEMEKHEEGLKNFAHIENHPDVPRYAPYLPTMLARMRAEKGELELAYDMLYNIYQKTDDESVFKETQKQRLYDLKAQIDLKCLNEGRNVNESKECQKRDFLGRPYINHEGKYRARGFKD